MFGHFASVVFCALLLLFCFQACVSRRTHDPRSYAGRALAIGRGGGFAGSEEEYRLLDNGRLYYRNTAGGVFTCVDSKKEKKAAAWFAEADRLAAAIPGFNHPGNRYRFIWYKRDSVETRLVWGEQSPEPAATLSDFYKRFSDYWIRDLKN